MKQRFDIKRIDVDGIDVAYTAIGSGDKLAVVCQGWGTSFGVYEIIANAITDEYTTILFDFPGFGNTKEPNESWDVSQYSSFFVDFLEALDIKKATLIGHSYGGRVILEIASNDAYKHLIQKIVLIDSAGIMPERSSQSQFKVRWFKAFKRFVTWAPVHALFPDVIDYWISKQGSEDYRNASDVMKGALVKAVNYDQQHLMHKIDAETLLVWGDADDATPLHDGEIMEKKIKNSSLVVFEGCGHFSYAEQPQRFALVLHSFLCGKGE